jgi:DNA-binding MarR family transcriptional regulator
MTDDATRVWRALRQLVLDGKHGQREVCRALDLSFVKVKALRHLANEPLSLGALASALITDAPYTSVIVADLERRGLVIRAPNPEDGRSKLVSVTVAGRRAARTADAILGEPPVVLRELDENDLATLDRITRTLLGEQVAR